MNPVNPDIQSQANEAALLNVLMYLDVKDADAKDGKTTVDDILTKLKTYYSEEGFEAFKEMHPKEADEWKDRKRQYDVLVNACADEKNKHLREMKIDNQSWKMDPPYEEGGLNACTFEDSNGNIMVVYRGTGKGEWLDNGYGVSGIEMDTKQQKEAMEYFNRVVEDNGYAFKNVNIDITGHSKGGNKSQYTLINSEYNYLVKSCFNFDGQGMSPEAIEEFKRRLGDKAFIETYGAGDGMSPEVIAELKKRLGEEAYNKEAEKMYGFYADNDFVNPLGVPVIPKDHRYYFESQIVEGVDDFQKYHFSDNYLKMDGTFSNQTEQGDISKLIQDFSEQIVDLPPEERSEVANAIMSLMQLGRNHDPVNGDKIPWTDLSQGLDKALPVLLDDLLKTPDGWRTLITLSGPIIHSTEDFAAKYGWTTAVAVAVLAIYSLPILKGVYELNKTIAVIETAVEKMIEFGKGAADAAKKIVESVKNLIRGFKNWFNTNFNTGYRYASANPYIKVNTYKLRSYADRLTSINRRLVNLDRRLDGLYYEVGLLDLFNLISADVLTGYSWRLKQCINYLNNTADDFENVETRLLGQITNY